MSKSFQEVQLWQKSHKLVVNMYKSTKVFPKEEKFGLSSQIRRSAISIPANFAEGYKRTNIKDKKRFYNIAQSSLEELRYYLILCKDLEYIKIDNHITEIDEVAKMLYSYIQKMPNS